ncbi:MAG: hypothetical protein WA744_19430, partial [Candidatus Acidiferrales bacterium]
RGVMRGEISAKFFSYCSGGSLGAVSRSIVGVSVHPLILKSDAILALGLAQLAKGFGGVQPGTQNRAVELRWTTASPGTLQSNAEQV